MHVDYANIAADLGDPKGKAVFNALSDQTKP